MKKNITELGPREAEFLAQMASRTSMSFTIHDAVSFWGSRERAREKLSHLVRKGWLERIERGKYLIIPLEAGPKRQWSENPLLIASMLAQPAVIAYWSAIRYWNWTEQLPRITYIQTTQRKNTPRKKVMGTQFEIVTVPVAKFFGHIKRWEGGISYWVTDKEKTLIDCASDVIRSGSIEELIKAVSSGVQEIDFVKLTRYASQFPNGAVKKRLGYLFEQSGRELSQEGEKMLLEWQDGLTKGISPLMPGGPESGNIVTRWRLHVNVEV